MKPTQEALWQAFIGRLNTRIQRKDGYTLDYVKKFHEVMGSPGDKLKIVHVGGTNAKGTITYKLACMLEFSGYKTGFFQSPHLFSWRERVQINRELVTKEYCIEFLNKYQKAREKVGADLSYFEFFTLLGYDYYANSGVDIAVVEVGLGGKLDATNILKGSLLSILTSVDLDHTHVLGSTREEIASKFRVQHQEISVA
jgi:dihydrofolate synthase / folylpolyglutamate synthase